MLLVVMLTESVSSNRARHCSLCCKTERVVPKPSSPCAFTRYARKMTSGGLLHQICVWRGHFGSGDRAPDRQLGPAGGGLRVSRGSRGSRLFFPLKLLPISGCNLLDADWEHQRNALLAIGGFRLRLRSAKTTGPKDGQSSLQRHFQLTEYLPAVCSVARASSMFGNTKERHRYTRTPFCSKPHPLGGGIIIQRLPYQSTFAVVGNNFSDQPDAAPIGVYHVSTPWNPRPGLPGLVEIPRLLALVNGLIFDVYSLVE